MANYVEILRHHPCVRDYLRNRRWVRRGDVTAYAPNITGKSFSTDALGQRHSIWLGQRLGLVHAMSGRPYGLVLGSSHVFGFGLPGDDATLASRLGERLGEPHLTIAFPEADLRDLEAVLRRILAEAPRPPARIVLMGGGTLTRYGYVRRCDPVFGVPDFRGTSEDSVPPDPGSADEAGQATLLSRYVAHLLDLIAADARAAGAALLVQQEWTAFEKPVLNEVERVCRLCEAPDAATAARFATQRLRREGYRETGARTAHALGLIPPAPVNPGQLGFIDEFHYDANGIERIADAVVVQAEQLERETA